MLLRCLLLFLFSFNAFAWEIKLQEGEYKLFSETKSFPLHFNNKAKLLKIDEKADYTVIEYDAGSQGTQTIVDVYRRLIVDKKGKLIVDKPYEYHTHDNSIPQPIWSFNEKEKTIEVQDAEEGFQKIFKY